MPVKLKPRNPRASKQNPSPNERAALRALESAAGEKDWKRFKQIASSGGEGAALKAVELMEKAKNWGIIYSICQASLEGGPGPEAASRAVKALWNGGEAGSALHAVAACAIEGSESSRETLERALPEIASGPLGRRLLARTCATLNESGHEEAGARLNAAIKAGAGRPPVPGREARAGFKERASL
jgi:hypothetical protein